MNKSELYSFLNERGISYERIDHPAVFTVAEAEALHLPHPEVGAKNLFLRDDKKRNYYLLTVRDALSVRLGDFQRKIGARRLSFASEADLMDMLGLIKGAVTPFGVLNDEARAVRVYFDAYFQGGRISVHPNDNTATVYLSCDDLLTLIREHGNEAEYIALEE